MNQGFGVTPEIRTQMKLAMFYVRDIVFLVGVLGCSVLLGNLFPPQQLVQLICFYVVNSLLGIWLVIQPFSNPGRRNYDLVLSDLFPQQRVFRSFDPQEFSSTTDYVDVEVNKND